MKPWGKSFTGIMRLLLACLFLSTLSACTGGSSSAPVERIRQQGKLRVALDPSFPPFEEEVGGQVQGIDVDLARELGRRLNVEVVFVRQPYDKIYQALDNNQADLIISALYPEGSSLTNYAFSPPYFNAGQIILVRADTPIQTKRDLSGRRIAALKDSEGLLEVTRWQYMLDPAPTVMPYDTAEEALAALQAGEGDALVVHALIGQQARLQSSDTLRLLNETVTDEVYVIAARREDEALIQIVADLLKQMQADGSMDQILKRWLLP